MKIMYANSVVDKKTSLQVASKLVFGETVHLKWEEINPDFSFHQAFWLLVWVLVFFITQFVPNEFKQHSKASQSPKAAWSVWHKLQSHRRGETTFDCAH